MSKIKRLAGFLGFILLSQSDLISQHKHAKQRFHMNIAVYLDLHQNLLTCTNSGLSFENSTHSCQYTVPAPIKDAASIQKLFLQPCTMVHLTNFYLFLVHSIDQQINKTYLILVIFQVRLLFKSVLYWPRYGNHCVLIDVCYFSSFPCNINVCYMQHPQHLF